MAFIEFPGSVNVNVGPGADFRTAKQAEYSEYLSPPNSVIIRTGLYLPISGPTVLPAGWCETVLGRF